MRILFLILFTIFIWCENSFSQTFSVSGKILDKSDNCGVEDALVSLINKYDTLNVIKSVTDSNGNFIFKNISAALYIIHVKNPLYISYEKEISVKNNVSDLKFILQPSEKTLKDFTKEETMQRGQQKGDTTEFNAKAFKVNPDSKAEDLITKMPGVTTDANGNIQANGENVKKVLIDGKEYFGDDASVALKNLPAEIIEKVQVFDRLSDQAQFTGFNDGNTDKTINIVTKRGMNNAVFGKIYGGYGTNKKYNNGGNLNFFNQKRRITIIGLSNNINQQNFSMQDLLGVTQQGGRGSGGGRGSMGGMGRGMFGGGQQGGLGGSQNFFVGQQNGINTTNSFGLNYQDIWWKKVKFTGSYFYNGMKNNSTSDLNRKYFLQNSNQNYYENDSIQNTNLNHRFSFRIEYNIDSFNSIILTPRFNLQENTGTSYINGENYILNNFISATINDLSSKNSGYNFANDILFRHKFKKQGRTISANFTTSLNYKTADNILSSTNVISKPNPNATIDQLSNILNNGNTYSGSFVYTEPTGKHSQFSLSYSPSYSNNISQKNTYKDTSQGTNEYNFHDTVLSNNFDNIILTHRAGMAFRVEKEKLEYMIGADFQYLILKSDESFPIINHIEKPFPNVLPKINFKYKFSSLSNFRIIYNANTNTPSVSQLQNVIDNSNPLNLSSGNADLKQSFSHNLVTRFGTTDSAKTKSFFTFFSLSLTENYIGNSTIVVRNDTTIYNVLMHRGTRFSQPVNIDGNWNFRSFVTYGIPWKKIKCNLNFNIGYSFLRSPSMINSLTNFSNTSNINSGIVLGSNISENIDFRITYSSNYYMVVNSIQQNANNNYYTGNLSAKCNFILKKKWVIASDVNYNHYAGLSNGYNPQIILWNGAVGYKFLKNNAGEIRITVFDILNQNNSINRTVSETYVEDSHTKVLTQYFMLNITYNIRKMGMMKIQN